MEQPNSYKDSHSDWICFRGWVGLRQESITQQRKRQGDGVRAFFETIKKTSPIVWESHICSTG